MKKIQASSPEELLKYIRAKKNLLSANELLELAFHLSAYDSWNINDSKHVGIQGDLIAEALAKGADINKFAYTQARGYRSVYFSRKLLLPHMDLLSEHLNGDNLLRFALDVMTLSQNKVTLQWEIDPNNVEAQRKLITRATNKLSPDEILRYVNFVTSKENEEYSEHIRIHSLLLTEALTKGAKINEYITKLGSRAHIYFPLSMFSHNMELLCKHLNGANLLALALQLNTVSFNGATSQWTTDHAKVSVQGNLIAEALAKGADINDPYACTHLTLEHLSQHEVLYTRINGYNLLDIALKTLAVQDSEKKIKEDFIRKALDEKGADINSRFAYEYLSLEYLLSHLYILSAYISDDNLFIKDSIANKMEIGINALERAAENGDLEGVKFLVGKGVEISSLAVFYAVTNGHSEVVEFLVGRGGKIKSGIVDYAVEKRYLKIVEVLVKTGGEKLSDDAVYNAVMKDDFKTAKALLDLGAPMGSVYHIAKAGNVLGAKFLLNHGAEIGKDDLYTAIMNDGDDALAEFLLNHGGKLNGRTIDKTDIKENSVLTAAVNDHVMLAELFMTLGGTLKQVPGSVYRAAIKGHCKGAGFLFKHGVEVREFDVANAIKAGNPEAAKCLWNLGGYDVANATKAQHVLKDEINNLVDNLGKQFLDYEYVTSSINYVPLEVLGNDKDSNHTAINDI